MAKNKSTTSTNGIPLPEGEWVKPDVRKNADGTLTIMVEGVPYTVQAGSTPSLIFQNTGDKNSELYTVFHRVDAALYGKGYGHISYSLFEEMVYRVGPLGACLYMYLLSLTGIRKDKYSWPVQNEMATFLDCTRQKVAIILDKLERNGYIKKINFRNIKGTHQTVYQIVRDIRDELKDQMERERVDKNKKATENDELYKSDFSMDPRPDEPITDPRYAHTVEELDDAWGD